MTDLDHHLDDLDARLDGLVASAAPITDEVLVALGLDIHLDELAAAVMATPRPAPAAARADRRWPRRAGAAAVGVAAALLLTIGSLALVGADDDTRHQAWAASQVRFAETSPLLLVTAPGWKVTGADEQPDGIGAITFGDGGSGEVELSWGDYEPTQAESAKVRADESDQAVEVPVPGGTATVYRFRGSDIYSAIWSRGPDTIELRGELPSPEAFEAILRSLRPVSLDRWLAALPSASVSADDRAAVIDQMLADVALPSGFDRSALLAGDEVRDRYQLGVAVAGAVACGWLDAWDAAEAADDEAGMAAATEAMAGSRRWRVLLDMDPEGAYPEVLWEVADSMAAGRPEVWGGAGPEDPRSGLGCPGA